MLRRILEQAYILIAKKRLLIFISRLFFYKNIALPDRKALFLFVQGKLLCIHPLDGNELVMV